MADESAPEPAPPPETDQDTAAVYLARCLIADLGYVPGHVPEAAPLAEVSDVVLTGGDGVGLAIACIIDRDAAPQRRFELPPERVDEIAAACRHHAGRVHGVREAVAVEIWEIGAGLPREGDRARLEAYTFRRRAHDGVTVKAYAVDSAPGSDGATFSTAGDSQRRAPWIRKVMTEPRRSRAVLAAEVAARRQTTARFQTPPIATLALLVAFAAMFVVELAWTLIPAPTLGTPSIGTMVSLGALDHGRVEDGEWWRLLTCAFLHGGILHLLFNGIAMYMAGGVLENLVGRAWMLALFVLGAIGGSMMSMAVNPPHVISVGASGAIMGLLAAAMVLSLRLPKGPARTQILVSLGYMLVPSLLPLATAGGNTDYGAHFGGAITGAALGGLLLVTWPRTADQPRARIVAAALAAAGLLFTAYGLVRVAADRDDYERAFAGHATRALNPELVQQLVPYDQQPTTDAEWLAELPRLQEKYPRDPRVLYMAGRRELGREDAGAAQAYFEQMLAEKELMSILYNDDHSLETLVRYFLARMYEENGEPEEARTVLQPTCPTGKRSANADVRTYYEDNCIGT